MEMVQVWKKWLKGEKGFTLVELLAVIVILGIIVAIAVPAIGNITERAQSDADDAQDELVLDAARLADVEGAFTSGTTTEWDLIDGGYLEQTGDFEDLTESNPGRTIYSDGGTYTFEDPNA